LTVDAEIVSGARDFEMMLARKGEIIRWITAIAAMALLAVPASAKIVNLDDQLVYRGFTIDMSAIDGAPNRAAIEGSVKHQIDIVADCGARPAILDFFRSQEIFIKPGALDGGGSFASNASGITDDAAVQPMEQPIILHELLHAYHFRALPGRFQNPDIVRFYNNAKLVGYPATAYMLKNPQEFFAVTGSLYLWGNVDRDPHTRQNLKARQPYYYAWLGQLFGVQK
jgi:hypothetical protein